MDRFDAVGRVSGHYCQDTTDRVLLTGHYLLILLMVDIALKVYAGLSKWPHSDPIQSQQTTYGGRLPEK